jgi:MerR family transcriptional regulator, light-induced transcriptional regulator
VNVLNYFSIKDIESLTGVKAHTLRIWEQRYGMITPKRTDTNIRYYDEADLKKLLNVSLLNRNGYKISEIASMNAETLMQEVLKLSREKSDYENQLQALTLTMLELNESAFEQLLNKSILQMGLEKTMMNLIFPFFRTIGIMWQTGSINPAHEHFITNIVRQKLIVAIDGQQNLSDIWSKKFMLFLPEGEFHEIGLLFANYAIRARGGRVVYIGANVPFNDLSTVYRVYSPDYLFTVVTAPLLGGESGSAYLDKLSKSFPEAVIYATGGTLTNDSDLTVPTNVRIIADLKEMLSIVSEAS